MNLTSESYRQHHHGLTDQSVECTRLKHHRLTNTIHLTMKMTCTQVVKTSVTSSSSFQNYPHLDDHTIQTITQRCVYRRLHLPVNAVPQNMFSHVWVSGVKLWSFPSQPWNFTSRHCSNSSQREDDSNQQERKKLSERRPTFNDLRSQVKDLAQDYSFSEVGRRFGCSFKSR